jgi:hypothetical protein
MTEKRPSPWKSTKAACQELDVSRWTLFNLRKTGQLRKGHHYRVKNPQAARLTYLWNCDRIKQTQSEVIEA